MSAHATILHIDILPHDAEHRLLRIHTLGVHVDFLLPNQVHDKLAAHFTPASCPLRNQQSEISNQQSPP
jgi:hypothetical protein